MAGEKVGEAYVDIRYRLNQLAGDLRTARTAIDNQVEQINRSVAQKTDGMLSGISTQLQGVTALTGAFGAAVLAAVGSQAIQAVNAFKDKIAETGSAFTQMQARLDQTLGAGAFDETIALANRLGVAIKDAADSTARFGMAAQDIGLTKEQTLLLTETVVKLGRIGNSSAEEMSNGMQQLGQALASGKFQGDELRSVLESMPEVARALAKELGVTIGQLREMGTEGKLTADVVAKALLGAADDAAERFAKLPESLEQSQAWWQNATDQLFAALDKALHASDFMTWWNKFRSEIAEGITVNLGGGTTETQLKVLEGRLKELREGRTSLFGFDRRSMIEEIEGQIQAIRRDASMAAREAGAVPNPTLSGPSAWSIYPERTLDDEKATKGYRDDAIQIAKEHQAEQERLNARAEAETERHNAEMASLEQSRLMDFQRDLDGEYKLQDEREQRAREANERLARANQEARRQELQAAREAREQAIKDDPAGYYAKTGDPELAPIYDAATGVEVALKDLGDQSQQYGRIFGDAIKAGADTAAQGLTQMALTGRFAIKSLLKDMAELALNQVFRMAISGALGAAGDYFFGTTNAPQGGAGGNHAGLVGAARGGVFDHGRITPLARGGIVSAATIVPLARGAALMGEAGPEAVMPLARDGSGRLGVRGGGGGGTKVIINDMRGAGSPPVKTEERPDGQGGIDIVATIEATVEKGIGGGRYDNAFNARFGQRPRTTR